MSHGEELDGQGFRIGSLYSLRIDNAFRFIPRQQISFVGATETKRIGFLILAGLLTAFAVYVFLNEDMQLRLVLSGIDPSVPAAISLAGALLFVVLYFATKRIGIVIASSGGQIFVEQRGKDRFVLLSKIHADLQQYYSQFR